MSSSRESKTFFDFLYIASRPRKPSWKEQPSSNCIESSSDVSKRHYCRSSDKVNNSPASVRGRSISWQALQARCFIAHAHQYYITSSCTAAGKDVSACQNSSRKPDLVWCHQCLHLPPDIPHYYIKMARHSKTHTDGQRN